jgi:PAS domain S-box-containing protein
LWFFLASCGLVVLVAKIASSNQDQYEALFGKSKIPILLVDPDSGAILEANAAACTYYGNSSERMYAQRIEDISVLPPEKILANLRRALTEEQDQFLIQHRRASGEVRQVEVRSEEKVT